MIKLNGGRRRVEPTLNEATARAIADDADELKTVAWYVTLFFDLRR
jgi:hypothetical protein